MIAALYLRVSTEEQAREGLSLSVQEERCREAALADGAEQVRVFRDDGYSGTTLDRPALQELLASLEAVDVVYVWKLDRLSRSVRDMANLTAGFAETGVGLKSVFASFARCSPAYNALMPVLGPM